MTTAAAWQSEVATTSAPWSGAAGSTVCFSVDATDVATNTSAYSKEACTVFPLDDAALAPTRFAAQASPGSFQGTVSKATAKGAKLAGPTVTGKRFAIIVTRCPGCGAIKVGWNGVTLATLSLAASTGKTVLVDGLAVSRN